MNDNKQMMMITSMPCYVFFLTEVTTATTLYYQYELITLLSRPQERDYCSCSVQQESVKFEPLFVTVHNLRLIENFKQSGSNMQLRLIVKNPTRLKVRRFRILVSLAGYLMKILATQNQTIQISQELC